MTAPDRLFRVRRPCSSFTVGLPNLQKGQDAEGPDDSGTDHHPDIHHSVTGSAERNSRDQIQQKNQEEKT